MIDPAEEPVEVLLVEDDEGDVKLIQEAFANGSGRKIHLTVASDGAQALELLRGRPRSPRPAIMILDLNLPKYDGRELLRDVKADQDLRRIPVVIFTTSNAEEEVVRAYSAHANCYVCKPMNLKGFFSSIQQIRDFWLSAATLPAR